LSGRVGLLGTGQGYAFPPSDDDQNKSDYHLGSHGYTSGYLRVNKTSTAVELKENNNGLGSPPAFGPFPGPHNPSAQFAQVLFYKICLYSQPLVGNRALYGHKAFRIFRSGKNV
jgi:hypothetical protein